MGGVDYALAMFNSSSSSSSFATTMSTPMSTPMPEILLNLWIKGTRMNVWVDCLDVQNVSLIEAQLMDGTVVTETVEIEDLIEAMEEYAADSL